MIARAPLWLLALLVWAGTLQAQCRQALVLGLDVSGSVDSREYRLQMRGLAAALRHPEVTDALLALPAAPVQLAIFEWSGPDYQNVLLDWTAIAGPGDLAGIAAQLDSLPRASAPPGTALGTAMQFGATKLAERPQCWKRTLDISGDGKHNMGPHPRDVRRAIRGRALTLNALVIGADAPRGGDIRQVEIGELTSYFNAWVITRAEAFVETALGFED